jgi:transcriptional regulator with XRE-family HTH domain
MTDAAASAQVGEAEIGRRVRELRLRAGASAEWLAARIGLSPSALSLLEHGGRAVKSAELTRIAVAPDVCPLAILDSRDSAARLLAVTATTVGHMSTEVAAESKTYTALQRLAEAVELAVVAAGHARQAQMWPESTSQSATPSAGTPLARIGPHQTRVVDGHMRVAEGQR